MSWLSIWIHFGTSQTVGSSVFDRGHHYSGLSCASAIAFYLSSCMSCKHACMQELTSLDKFVRGMGLRERSVVLLMLFGSFWKLQHAKALNPLTDWRQGIATFYGGAPDGMVRLESNCVLGGSGRCAATKVDFCREMCSYCLCTCRVPTITATAPAL